MKQRLIAALAVITGLLAFTGVAQAQFKVGGHAGFDFDASDLYVGGNAVLPLGLEVGGTALSLNGTASYWITSDGYNLFVIDGNLLYPFSVESESFSPYVGAGLVLSFFSVDIDCEPFCDIIGDFGGSSTDFGLNLKGGSEFGSGGLKPFGEVGIYLKDGSIFYAQGGVRVTMGDS